MSGVLLILVLLSVGACGGEASNGASPPPLTDATPVPTPAGADSVADPDSDEGGSDVVIRFSVEGGFAGLSRTLTILADGEALVETTGGTTEGHVDSVELARLMEQLEASGLFDEDGVFEAEGADLQRYEIQFFGATVAATDGAVPRRLVEPIETLQRMANDMLSG